MKLISAALLVSHSDTSNDDSLAQFLNMLFIVVALLVSHLDTSKVDKFEQP